jgi:hypothetical protein
MAFLSYCGVKSCSTHAASIWMLAFGGLLFLTIGTTAQTTQSAPASKTGTTSSTKTTKSPGSTSDTSRHVAHHHARHTTKIKEEPVVAPPPPPVPPEQQPPNPPKIDYKQGMLRIDADNSSLVQILAEVSHETGMAVQGLNRDERVYGQYGPGSVSSTLTKLLDGAGYNYIIVGGGGDASPTKLMLTAGSSRSTVVPATPATPAASTGATAPPPVNPSPTTQAKTPQQIFDELRKMHPPH